MEHNFGEYLISDDKEKLQIDRICALLSTTYWAKGRKRETIEKTLGASLCFGIYRGGRQVGFARCVTDYATIYWLADVVIDESCRAQGLGKELMNCVVGHELLQGLSGILITDDAHGLYEQYGFKLVEGQYMRRNPK